MNNKVQEKYGVFTAASLVVGIVIGSGIFFKADDVLVNTGGSVLLGVLAFLFVGIGVLFGALVISQYALLNDGEGGIIAYSKQAFGEKFAFIVGWLMVSLYFPSLIIILAWVCALYTSFVVGIDSSLFIWITTLIYLIIAYLSNVLSPILSGKIQVVTTIAKLIPLVLISIVGLLNISSLFETTQAINTTSGSSNIFLAIIAIAFTFDGWIIATSVSAEIKDSKKNLPKALIYGVVAIIIIYIAYFIGISAMVGPDQIIALGDAHVGVAAEQLFGSFGNTLINVLVTISVYGALNGLVLTYIRYPHALVVNGVFRDKLHFSKIDERFNVSLGSVYFSLIFVIFFYIFTYITMEVEWFVSRGFDSSAIAIIVVYIVYIILYFGVIKFIKQGITPKIYYLYIALAILTSIIIIGGSLLPTEGVIISNGVLYILLTAFMYIFCFPFYKSSK